tara:strand:- start:133 stop:603 length:471 start_codon:yes stop_codon:yes gene_type:complete
MNRLLSYGVLHLKNKFKIYYIMKKIVFTLTTLLFLTSCTTLRVSTETAGVNPSTTSDPIKVNIDVDGSEKVSATSKSTYFLSFLRLSGDNQFADDNFKGTGGSTKSAAHYNALKSSGADLLINPQYEIKKTIGFLYLWTTIEAKVTGFKGTYSLEK